MLFSKDMKDLLEIFEKIGVQYVLVGGYAVNYHGYIRTTQDIDLLVYPSSENAQKVMASLTEFGFGEAGIPRIYFEKAGSAVHLGVEPNRIDLLTNLKGVTNDQIFTNMTRVEFEDILVNIISFHDLIESKRCSDRPRDRADAEELERIENEKQE